MRIDPGGMHGLLTGVTTMGSDMVVALARASADGRTLFGHNNNRQAREGYALVRVEGRAYAPGETLSTGRLSLPQPRQTCTVLAGRRAGQWGYAHGINEHGVAAGVTSVRTRMANDRTGLSGPDLVRLALERAAGARQAVDLITDLVARHGQHADEAAEAQDSSFLVADGREAYAVECCGRFWAEQVVGSVRAVTDICHLRQDWDRIARGLADCAIENGWWPANGSKLDFAQSVRPVGGDGTAGLGRWGRATLVLEQHSGQIDLPLLRRLLADHGGRPGAAGASLCQHGGNADQPCTSSSLAASVGLAGSLPVAWCAFGPPCAGVWFPLLLPGELPAAFQEQGEEGACEVWRRMTHLAAEAQRGPERQAAVAEALGGLQEQFDQDTREFLAEAAVLQQRGEKSQLHRLAGSLMHHSVERWEAVVEGLLPQWRAQAPHQGKTFEYAGVWE
jgi:dipeptidase